MARVIGLFTRVQGMSAEEFRDYYDNHHAPFAASHFGHLWSEYSRHWIDRSEGQPGPDVVTEIVFADDAAMDEMFATTRRDLSLRDAIVADEDKFIDRAATQLLISRSSTQTPLPADQ